MLWYTLLYVIASTAPLLPGSQDLIIRENQELKSENGIMKAEILLLKSQIALLIQELAAMQAKYAALQSKAASSGMVDINESGVKLGNYVVNVLVDSPGLCSSPPELLVSGGEGSGVSLKASLSKEGCSASGSCPVKAVDVLSGGTGFISNPLVMVNQETNPCMSSPLFQARISNHASVSSGVREVHIVSGGANFVEGPTVVISGGGGSGAQATATVMAGKVIGVTITSPGSGYSTSPSVKFVGGGGAGATAKVSLDFMPLRDLADGTPLSSTKAQNQATLISVRNSSSLSPSL